MECAGACGVSGIILVIAATLVDAWTLVIAATLVDVWTLVVAIKRQHNRIIRCRVLRLC